LEEKSDTVHGRLLEAVHISGYSFERACRELEYLLEDNRWKVCGPGFDRIDDFLATVNFSEFKIAVEQRKKLAKKLTDLRANQSAVARLIGVNEITIRRDIGKKHESTNVESGENNSLYNNNLEKHKSTNVEPAFSYSPQDAAKLLDTKSARIAKDIERDEKRKENEELVKGSIILDGKATTIVIDPPWDRTDEGDQDQLGRGQPTYAMMSFEQLLVLPISEHVEENAHIYLWITNRSFPKGFALLEKWGFRYITCLTWCKPSFGIGNYFRGQTEHILFGIRGSLSLLRSDVGTWFQWPRGQKHSEKPEEFYNLIETCSPGPWMDLFARRKRSGWICRGAEL